jgi:pyrroloquinoline-quinone synthase
MLQDYACQYYHFVKAFPRMVSAVHSNTPDYDIRLELLKNLMDEELGADNHPALWMRFANALGADTDRVLSTSPLPETSALVDTMMNVCRLASFQEGIAALYAFESQIPEVARVKIQGLRDLYGISDPAAVKFFSVHEEADIHHSRSERTLLQATTPATLLEEVVQASAKTAHALWSFLDGIYDTSVAGTATAH